MFKAWQCKKLKGKSSVKKIKNLLNLIRVTRIDEILNMKVNTNKTIEQILKQFAKFIII